MGTLLFAAVVGLSMGHALYHTTRGSFLNARELDALTRTLSERVEARTGELRLLARHVETLQEDERAAIARELHDEPGQLLTGMRVELDLAERHRLPGTGSGSPYAPLEAIRTVAQGRRYLTPEAADALLLGREESPVERLSEREHQVFLLVAQGRAPGDIAPPSSTSRPPGSPATSSTSARSWARAPTASSSSTPTDRAS